MFDGPFLLADETGVVRPASHDSTNLSTSLSLGAAGSSTARRPHFKKRTRSNTGLGGAGACLLPACAPAPSIQYEHRQSAEQWRADARTSECTILRRVW